MADLHEDEHPRQPHSHGDPFVWDPEHERKRRGVRFIVIGALLVLAGALLWWLGTR